MSSEQGEQDMGGARVLVVPGGTQVGAIAMAYASMHKLVELHEQAEMAVSHAGARSSADAGGPGAEQETAGTRTTDEATAPHTPPHTVVVLRDPARVDRTTLRGALTTPELAFPELPADVLADPHLLDGVDLVVPTSGSTSGVPRLVGLSVDALIASARATEKVLSGPGNWILALPAHHIAGAQVLFRAALAGTSPQVVDTSRGFDPSDLLPAIAGATGGDLPAYLSLVPAQLRTCLGAGPEVIAALGTLTSVLVGGSGLDPVLREAAESLGIPVVATYGMTETAGGCVYDGIPLPGTAVRTLDIEGHLRLAVTGATLMTKYLGADAPFIDEAGSRWLVTGDIGIITASGQVEVLGRSDEVIVSGGLSIAPAPVRQAVLSAPGVQDAWVIGLPDPKWDSALTAVVVPDPALGIDTALPAPAADRPTDTVDEGAKADPTAASPAMTRFGRGVRDHVGGLLGRRQAPRVVVAVPELPLLPSGKVDRRLLRAQVEARIGTHAEWRR